MLTYFDIVFADTRGAEWGSAVDGPATTLSAACGQSCLEGSRVITVGRPLVEEEGVWAFDLLHTLELSCGAAGLVWEVARSAKSTPPDSTQNAEAGYQVGSWVQLVGLKTQPILNGSQAVILEVSHLPSHRSRVCLAPSASPCARPSACVCSGGLEKDDVVRATQVHEDNVLTVLIDDLWCACRACDRLCPLLPVAICVIPLVSPLPSGPLTLANAVCRRATAKPSRSEAKTRFPSQWSIREPPRSQTGTRPKSCMPIRRTEHTPQARTQLHPSRRPFAQLR
jgi:hypothetical protein